MLATAHPMWMTLDPPLQIIGVHRYGSFESPEMLHERYGNMSSSTFAPWPILLPEPTTTVFDPSTGATRAASFFEAFDTPVTPSFILLDQEGRDVWTGREYQPGTGSLDPIGATWASVVGDSEGGMA